VVGTDTTAWRGDVGYFAPGNADGQRCRPHGADGPARRQTGQGKALDKAGYRGERVVVMTPSDYPRINCPGAGSPPT